MSSSRATTVGIQSLGLRSTFDPNKQQESIQQQNEHRRKVYLKEMLAKKFLHKHKLDQLGPINSKSHHQEQAIQKIVTTNFDKFVDQNTFTQKNLEKFESALLQKL